MVIAYKEYYVVRFSDYIFGSKSACYKPSLTELKLSPYLMIAVLVRDITFITAGGDYKNGGGGITKLHHPFLGGITKTGEPNVGGSQNHILGYHKMSLIGYRKYPA